ncbi:MAG: ribosome biogenesis GTPase Der [Puniceicoccales bacterium]|jgi:GTP-binding protein|nr:ribosome biogenesis GTPase Der [Puniceicoccales bacterium]
MKRSPPNLTTLSRKDSLRLILVGRPNVGKSRLFNRLCGRRLAIVHDQAGVTRDVLAEEISPGIVLLDSGGIGLVSDEEAVLLRAVEEQVDFAIAAADRILLVVDASVGCLPLDFEIAQKLRRAGKPILLLANKADVGERRLRLDSFHALGLGPPLVLSAEHGQGEEALRREIETWAQERLRPLPETDEERKPIALCFAGRPNVGKSSLINALLREKRAVVSPVSGTTRDAVAYRLDFSSAGGRIFQFRLLDTAGVRAKKKLALPVDYFSQVRTERAMAEADIVFLVIDALGGLTRSDQLLAARVLEAGRGLLLVVHKWDLAEAALREGKLENYGTLGDFQRDFARAVRRELPSLPCLPVLFSSIHMAGGAELLLEEAQRLHALMAQSLPTGPLNRALQRLMEAHPPALAVGRRFKVYYATQTGNFPFRLKIFCNRRERLADSYQRYLEKGLRKRFHLEACPLRFEWVEKERRPYP